jgi:hypothetical protein
MSEMETLIGTLLDEAKRRQPRSTCVAVGSTGYLDERLVPEQSVSWGSDRFGRPFVTLCLCWQDDEEPTEYAVNTFFQRYKDSPGNWAVAANAGRTLPSTVGMLRSSDLADIIALVRDVQVVADNLIIQLAEPADVRKALNWTQRPRAVDEEPGVAVHVDTAAVIVHDERDPRGRHEP